jgi:ribosomal protein L37AE/L43A
MENEEVKEKVISQKKGRIMCPECGGDVNVYAKDKQGYYTCNECDVLFELVKD